jgi:Hemerythrin HHE cation binding domain
MSTIAAPITSVPFDLYRDIHKAIRVVMFDVTAEAGRLDPSDGVARTRHACQVRELVRLLTFHALHEDAHIEAAVREVLPDKADEIAADHVALEARMEALVTLADLADDCTRHDDRAAVHCLYLELASFVSAYLAHQDMEERVVMPALWEAQGIEPLLDIHNTILSSISPDDMGWALSMMLPAMNNDDRTEMLGAMRAEAPTEVFEAVRGLASQVLSATDFATVSGRVGATLESV